MVTRLAIIITVVLVMFWRTFKYGYIIDDLESVKPKDQETKKFFKRVWEHLRGQKYTDSRLAHILSTGLHCINCCLVYLALGRTDLSFLAAILFAINPVNNSGSMWLSGKPYSMGTMLLLIGLWILPLMPFIYGFTIWWSPNALFFPMIFLMHEPWWYFLLLPMIGYLFSKKFRSTLKTRIKGGTDEMVVIAPRKLILVCKTLGYYFKHCLFPVRIGMCHSYLHTFGLTEKETKVWYKLDKYFFLGLALILLCIPAFINRASPFCFGYLWFIFLTLQWCNFVMVNHPITERYIYLPTIGLMYMLATMIIGTPFMWMFLVFYATRMFYFMPAYENVMTFWKSNTENFPGVAMGYNQYGLGLLSFGNTGSAVDVWVKGIQQRPNDFRISFNLANVLIGSKMFPQAMGFLKTAEENMDKKQNPEFWQSQIDIMKQECIKNGYQFQDTTIGSSS